MLWVSQSRKLWRFRSCSACRCLLAQFIDGCGRPCDHAVTFLVCNSWTRSSSCPLRADSWGPDVQKTVLFHSCSSRQGGGRPCDQAATFAKWKCPRFSSSPDSVDFPVVQQICLWRLWRRCFYGRGTGFSAVLTLFFALLRVVPEMSASFWSPRRRRVLRCRGLPLPIHPEVLWTYSYVTEQQQQPGSDRLRVALLCW